jgi:HAD superfamily phosphoserine phosphatase-like hydrolase
MKQRQYFKKEILIFDLGHTIISCDSLKYFLFKWFCKKPKIFFINSLYLILIYVLFKITLINRKQLKEVFLRVAFKGSNKKEILKFSESFATLLISKYLREKSKKILNKKNCIKILISASPNFYVNIIGKILKFDKVYSTKIDLNKKIGKIIGKNCYGSQKLYIIKKLKYNTKYLYFFTDSRSDVPLLNYCKKTFVIPKTISDKFFLKKYKKLNW